MPTVTSAVKASQCWTRASRSTDLFTVTSFISIQRLLFVFLSSLFPQNVKHSHSNLYRLFPSTGDAAVPGRERGAASQWSVPGFLEDPGVCRVRQDPRAPQDTQLSAFRQDQGLPQRVQVSPINNVDVSGVHLSGARVCQFGV